MEMNRELWELPCKCTSSTLVSGGPFPVARWIITMFLPRVRVLMWGAFGPPQVLFMAMIYSLKEQTAPDKTIWFLIDLVTSQFTMHIYINTYDETDEKLKKSLAILVLDYLVLKKTLKSLRYMWNKTTFGSSCLLHCRYRRSGCIAYLKSHSAPPLQNSAVFPAWLIVWVTDMLLTLFGDEHKQRHTSRDTHTQVTVKYLLKTQVSNFQTFLCLMRQQ